MPVQTMIRTNTFSTFCHVLYLHTNNFQDPFNETPKYTTIRTFGQKPVGPHQF